MPSRDSSTQRGCCRWRRPGQADHLTVPLPGQQAQQERAERVLLQVQGERVVRLLLQLHRAEDVRGSGHVHRGSQRQRATRVRGGQHQTRLQLALRRRARVGEQGVPQVGGDRGGPAPEQVHQRLAVGVAQRRGDGAHRRNHLAGSLAGVLPAQVDELLGEGRA
nr:hypothetical protein GCM10020241_60660 [Streptoalloteichus tenebrarius]